MCCLATWADLGTLSDEGLEKARDGPYGWMDGYAHVPCRHGTGFPSVPCFARICVCDVSKTISNLLSPFDRILLSHRHACMRFFAFFAFFGAGS